MPNAIICINVVFGYKNHGISCLALMINLRIPRGFDVQLEQS